MSDPRGAAEAPATEAGATPSHLLTPTGEPTAYADAPLDETLEEKLDAAALEADAVEALVPAEPGPPSEPPPPVENSTEPVEDPTEVLDVVDPADSTEAVARVTVPGQDPTPDEPVLDASVHAHVLDDPLPPAVTDADTPLFEETRPHSDADPAGAPGADGAPEDAHDAGCTATVTGDRPRLDAQEGPTSGASGSDDSPEARHGAAVEAHVRHARLGPLWEPGSRGRGIRIAARVAVGMALLATTVLSAYLYESARGWRDHADRYLAQSLELGDELATSRTDLAGARAELEAVREQLATAHQRITELASEKAQLSDEWEITRQLVDYQERVSDAAGQVALALDQCVQGQQELIGYLARAAEDANTLATPPPYDPAQLEQFEKDVEALCQEATEANIALQRELAR